MFLYQLYVVPVVIDALAVKLPTPAQKGRPEDEIETLNGLGVVRVILILLLVAVCDVTHMRPLVITQLMTCPFVNVLVV